MSDSILYYTKELTIQLLGGIFVGSSVNWLFPYPKMHINNSNVLKTSVELLLQVASSSTMAVFYFAWLDNRGWSPTAVLGTAPFWIFMFGSQPKLQQKASSMMKYLLGYIESIDQSLSDEVRKDATDARNRVIGAL
jgi:hypothetical protein